MNLAGDRWRKFLVPVFVVVLILGGLWQARVIWQWFMADRIGVADLRYRWTVDFDAYRVLHQHDFGFNEQDLATLQKSIGAVSIDLSDETAQVVRDQQTWTGGWTAHQEAGSSDAVVVTWQAPGCPMGKRTVFVRQEGRIACVLLGAPVPLKH